MTRSERYPRSDRIVSGDEIDEVVRHGRRARRAHLDVFWIAAETGHPRMGLIVPRFRQTAVARNRLRRQLREIWRRELAHRLPPRRIILKARRDSYQASFASLRDDLVAWCGATGG